MFNLCFFSGHGGSTTEIAQLCSLANVKLTLPGEVTRDQFRHLVKDIDGANRGLHVYKTLDDLKLATTNEINAFMVSRPECIEPLRELAPHIPIIARHSVNSFKRYQDLNLKNFISPSRLALKKMNAPVQWLSKKTRDFSQFDKRGKPKPARERKGFYSYIHHFQKYWPRAFSFWTEVKSLLDSSIPMQHYGRDIEIVDDIKTMLTSKATLHIKDGQVACNAPINSICTGTPVLMDYETLDILGMHDYIIHDVSGLLFETPSQCAEWINILENDSIYLDQLSERCYNFARLKCTYSHYDLTSFRQFLLRLQ